MSVRRSRHVAVLAALLMILTAGTALGKDAAVEPISDVGAIDWVKEKLTAVGVGAPVTRNVGQAQMRLLAQRAAVVVARRNLLEVVKGVHIDATTTLENFLVKSDIIETRVSGLLVNSTVEKVDYYSNGSAKARVSIPLTGELRALMLRTAVQGAAAGDPAATQRLENRLERLERRIQELERQVGGLKKASAADREMVHMLGSLVASWAEYTRTRPLVVTAAMDGNAAVNDRLARQERLLNSLAVKLNEINRRLEALERGGDTARAPKKTMAQVKFTGLVIDARGIDFKPCLKPDIVGKDLVLYPGDYIDLDAAVTGGYVRYYRDLAMAQRNDRVGVLPMTIKAIGTRPDGRSLVISAPDYDLLKEISTIQENFLGQCRITVVF